MANDASKLPVGIRIILFVIDVVDNLGKGKDLLEVFFLGRAFELNPLRIAFEGI